MHRFLKKDDATGVWLVKCPKTDLEFSTVVWRTGETKSQHCPHCGLHVKTFIPAWEYYTKPNKKQLARLAQRKLNDY